MKIEIEHTINVSPKLIGFLSSLVAARPQGVPEDLHDWYVRQVNPPVATQEESAKEESAKETPKRGRGRPPKNAPPVEETPEPEAEETPEPEAEETPEPEAVDRKAQLERIKVQATELITAHGAPVAAQVKALAVKHGAERISKLELDERLDKVAAALDAIAAAQDAAV